MRLASHRLLEAPFALAVLAGAGLTFWIEPLFAKMLLPVFGGAPSVWTTALMFFQGALLAGYLYAHLLGRIASPRRQAAVHAGLLALAAATSFPPSLPSVSPDPTAAPVFAVLQALLTALGLPLMALTATAPLVQRWFGGTRHPDAADPYFLYAASNFGSLVALLAFPLLLEPNFGLAAQSTAWMAGYALVGVLVILCGRLPVQPLPHPVKGAGGSSPRWTWVLLAAVPSSLLSGVTTAITTDIASGPLLWALPLALYLATFILAFARRKLVPLRLALVMQPILLVPVMAPAAFLSLAGALPVVALHLCAFFATALICHSVLAERRPDGGRLTEYYLLMAFGGLLGGAFNALVAPFAFTEVVEYPLALVIALALRPGSDTAPRWSDGAWPAMLLAGALGAAALLPGEADVRTGLAGLALALAVLPMSTRPARMAAAAAAAFLFPALAGTDGQTLFRERNFFGVVRVSEAAGAHVLTHGSTVHGVQATAAGELTPRAYYHPLGPAGDAIASLPAALRQGEVAVLGLGAGSLACYFDAARSLAFYDIDPAVMRAAADPRLFTFVAKCRSDAALVLGDARLRLSDTIERNSLLVLDVFSSDSIPVHLLTREAFTLYLAKLAENGVLLANISNRYLDLAPTVAAIAASLGLDGRLRCDTATDPAERRYPSCWVAMARSPAPLAGLAAERGWRPLSEQPPARVWTDDFSDTLGPLLRRLFRAASA